MPSVPAGVVHCISVLDIEVILADISPMVTVAFNKFVPVIITCWLPLIEP